ncbi:ABC transporter permease [Marinobacter oulmenensis]|uniref:ABC-2 type transport system permease protein n=1 Tax=Marinobacter oulmenensis TaxID=643747 RepID=A0A840U5Q3_9GAMM|nr:ABC transporter permease [Marinobacter oulmenensis]MBB5320272.1 ABC-2 type transport system permease protein [Marinobacter oulmenensis]
MTGMGALIRKELLLLLRDPHGLLLLFVMPAIFVLIMTFALQNQYSMSRDVTIDFLLVNEDDGGLSRAFARQLGNMSPLNRQERDLGWQDMQALARQGEVKFLVRIRPGFQDRLGQRQPAVEVVLAPGLSPVFVSVVEARLTELLNRFYLRLRLATLPGVQSSFEARASDLMETRSLYDDSGALPSSVQQNVPAWLLFAMFFIAVPLSTTLISERQQGTLLRLRSMGVGAGRVLFGKVIPFFLVNLLQVVLMFLIGLYLIPLLGGDRLTLGAHPAGLVLVSVAASLAAVSYALLVAQITRTIEQATIVSAVFNIIMAALGGVMVPRFLMPDLMQQVGGYSPMAWGLEGYFDILLRNGTVVDVLPEVGALLAFAALMLALAVWRYRRVGPEQG